MARSPIPRTAFARALGTLSPAEQTRAQRLKAAFNLREDDAVWELCGLIKGFDVALREVPTKCSAAADQVARWEIAPKGDRIATEPTADGDGGLLANLLGSSAFVTATMIIGTSGFTVGATLRTGSAYWAPHDSLTEGGAAYLLAAIWSAPVAGWFTVFGLLQLVLRWAVARLGRAVLPSPSPR